MNFIVSVDQHWGIGKQNDLLFSIREDMRFFKNTTMGGTVVMGDKTLLSLPGAKPLPGRENLVLSLDPAFSAEGITLFSSIETLFDRLRGTDTSRVFVIGGATSLQSADGLLRNRLYHQGRGRRRGGGLFEGYRRTAKLGVSRLLRPAPARLSRLPFLYISQQECKTNVRFLKNSI